MDSAGGEPVRARHRLARMGRKRGHGDTGRRAVRRAGLGRGGPAAASGRADFAHRLRPRPGNVAGPQSQCRRSRRRKSQQERRPAFALAGPAPGLQARGPASGRRGRAVPARLRPRRPVSLRIAGVPDRGKARAGGRGHHSLGRGRPPGDAGREQDPGERPAVCAAHRRPLRPGAGRVLAGRPQPRDGLAALVPRCARPADPYPGMAHRRATEFRSLSGGVGAGRCGVPPHRASAPPLPRREGVQEWQERPRQAAPLL